MPRLRPMRRNTFGRLLVVLGMIVLLVDPVIHWYYELRLSRHYDVNLGLVLLGCAIAFVGFYIQDPKGAEDAGAFLSDRGLAFVQIVRTGKTEIRPGRRAGDGPDTTVVTTVVDPPGPPGPQTAPLTPTKEPP